MSEPFELTAGEPGQRRVLDARACDARRGWLQTRRATVSELGLADERRIARELRDVDGCERLLDLGRRGTS